MEYSGAGGKLIHEKTRSKKSRDTVPLTHSETEKYIFSLTLAEFEGALRRFEPGPVLHIDLCH